MALRCARHGQGELAFSDDMLLAVNGQDYLPFNPNMPCVQDRFDASGENINCFLAGDPR